MLIKSIKLTNFLSYGDHSESIPLGPLNVIIGPNGSGKSNLLEAIELLKSAPKDLIAPIRTGGGVRNWLWKGCTPSMPASLEAVFYSPKKINDLRYSLSFTEAAQEFKITKEHIEKAEPGPAHSIYPYYSFQNGDGILSVRGPRLEDIDRVLKNVKDGHRRLSREDIEHILKDVNKESIERMLSDTIAPRRPQPEGIDRVLKNVKDDHRKLRREDIEPNQSILSQRKDPDQYPELTFLGTTLTKIRIYREWCFGRFTAARISQKADLPNDFLEPDCSNLGLVLNRLQENHDLKKRLIEELRALYEGIQDYYVRIDGGTVQVFFQEQVNTRTVPISAARLSDGTLRYLCLLAILCHPDPPPLVCIEEPELGLHPDVLPNLAQLLKDASERTQLIVTTHSDVLVDAFTDQPDAILVADRGENGTTLTRLDKEKLKPWLEKYRLGQLWTRGDIGGTRW
ncbi:AAA family ATPase [Verminephrobacter aporrectodeae]|uniref:AAA family ATPase n=1 Tax=Verminephrobacter aporrectodeae TaxID=1110389 RepID=UPI002244BF5C|nr:AAA family ATPase [Verminephrobacter aporrectodeae]MCW8166058.1 chromosome segregation protein SMC [Verminephrobacter aporrectodeae subsp. tuberculatae]MCW8170067.1 chromosome segregation protein SMC [Verminephrobacter aporrectodeae subsp. tuberculatae]MCW8174229.1 chromosome segregation protein SMC [Verminephrobacter aporrectodeae subsp. tuberculatae]MCW8201929.1 chromosome segregation protein SMC [Verminephrobacter aporrectodeae subsp. tuberculatae]